MTRIQPNPPFAALSPVAHGAFDYGELSELGLVPEDIIDFSSSINPYGPAPEVEKAARQVDISRYPDKECRKLRLALSEHLGVDASCIAVGNGSAELIDHLARIYLNRDATTLIVGPTFGEYERASRLCGARVIHYDRRVSDREVNLALPSLLDAIGRERPRVVWICNPNNPTGDYLPRAPIERLLETAASVGGLLIVDEAYGDLMLSEAPDDLTGLSCRGNLVLLRSMTKSHALAGLRLGYISAVPEIVRALTVARPPWNVSAPAQAAGVSALAVPALDHLEESRRLMARTADQLRRKLLDLGFGVPRCRTNFLLARVGDAAHVRRELLVKGLQVRDCASFGLPEYIRVAVRRPEECRRLVSELQLLTERPTTDD